MDLQEMFAEMPLNEHLGIELQEAEDGQAVGHLELGEEHSSNPEKLIAHGGVTYSLADSVGGAAVVSANYEVAPTIDMRMDYLAPATGGTLEASAQVVHNGDHVATVEVDITDDDGTEVARARGTYKSGGGDGDSPWTDEDDG